MDERGTLYDRVLCIKISNIGNRAIFVEWLGVAVRREKTFQRLQPKRDDFFKECLLNSSETASVRYTKRELREIVSTLGSTTCLYVYAEDSENKKYYEQIKEAELLKILDRRICK